MERLTIEYCGEYVPKDMCSIDRLGGADDCDLCCEYCKATEDGNEDCKGCAINQCFNKLGEYETLEEQGNLLIVPEIPKNKTLYWIWADEIMPVIFKGITSCIVDNKKKPHIMCEMETKKDRTFTHTYRRKKVENTIKAGDKRYFYSEDIGRSIFFNREEAEAALKAMSE